MDLLIQCWGLHNCSEQKHFIWSKNERGINHLFFFYILFWTIKQFLLKYMSMNFMKHNVIVNPLLFSLPIHSCLLVIFYTLTYWDEWESNLPEQKQHWNACLWIYFIHILTDFLFLPITKIWIYCPKLRHINADALLT